MKLSAGLAFLVAAAAGKAVVAGSDDLDAKFVLKMDPYVTLEEARAAIEDGGGRIEKGLSCTRGIVFSNVDEAGRRLMEETEGMRIVEWTDTHGAEKELEGGLNRELQKKCFCPHKYGNQYGCTLTPAHIEIIKGWILFGLTGDPANNITNYDGTFDIIDTMGAALRGCFHDYASFDRKKPWALGGLNGCIDMNHPGNGGLGPYNIFLDDLQKKTHVELKQYISRGDLVALITAVVLEHAYSRRPLAVLPFVGPATNLTMDNFVPLKFKCGRIDVPCSCEKAFLPSPEGDAAIHLDKFDEIFSGRYGWLPHHTVAAMSLHGIGKLNEFNSGFTTKPWIGADQGSMLWPEYFNFMFNPPWFKTSIQALNDPTNSTTLTEWRLAFGPNHINTFLNTDAILCFDIANASCTKFGGAPDPTDCRLNSEYSGSDLALTKLKHAYGQACSDFRAFDTVKNVFINEDKWMYWVADVLQIMIDSAPCGHLIDPYEAPAPPKPCRGRWCGYHSYKLKGPMKKACGGYFSCAFDGVSKLGVGAKGCMGEGACTYCQKMAVGKRACTGKESCTDNVNVKIMPGACGGKESCKFMKDITVGYGACNKYGSCIGCTKDVPPKQQWCD